MTTLRFSLSPESITNLNEALICLAKFGESVAIEGRREKLTLTALNLSRTAYAAITLDAKTYFTSYVCIPRRGEDRFTASLYNKALQCAFKGRSTEIRGRDGLIERCDVELKDKPDDPECRLIVKTYYKHGMTKTYRLNYESLQIMHALFDRTAATQGWRISSRTMREYIEYFGPRTEQLDLVAQDGKMVFVSFTEKISDGKAILKQPLETSINLHIDDFEDFHMREQMHIVISVKDFKAIVTHAETLHGSLSAAFSSPTKPLLLHYTRNGMLCEYTLMTTGISQQSTATEPTTFLTTRSSARSQAASTAAMQMPPPKVPQRSGTASDGQRQATRRPLGSQSQALRVRPNHDPSMTQDDPDPESLFMPANDDQAWEPPDYEQDAQDEMLGYDASYNDTSAQSHRVFQDSVVPPTRHNSLLTAATEASQEGLEPTQRLSQLHGMFD